MRRSRSRRSIRDTILRRALLLSLVPLLVLGGVAVASLRGLQTSVDAAIADTQTGLADEVAGRSLRQDAAEIGLQYERYLGERVDDAVAWSDAPVVQDAANGEATAEAERFLQRRVLAPGTPFLALALVDVDGETIVGIDGDVTADPDISWTRPALDEGAFLSPVDLTATIPYMDMSVRVEATDGTPIGVLWGALNADFFQTLADGYRLEKDSDVHISVFDRQGALLAETASDHEPQRLFDVDLVRTADEQAFFDRAVEIDPEDELSLSEGYVSAAGDFAAHGFVTQVPSVLRSDNTLRTNWITEVREPEGRALAPLAAADRVPASLDSSIRAVLIAIAAAILLALLASIAVGRVLARNIVRPIEKLRDEADAVANEHLPYAVNAIAEGEQPPMAENIDVGADDEVGELADSFNEVQRTAISLAADQALIRRNFSDLFVYLGRRNQNLLGRQLELIDTLEREEDDPELLASLFGLDHLATRMRRNAESLLVIAGRESTRTWSEPVPVRDVVRAASSEVEDYARVQLGQFAEAHLRGEAVSDMAHLLAELLENALQYSPPSAPVTVCGQPYRDGAYAISIGDQGLGLQEADLARINAALEATGSAIEPDSIPTDSLGLFVVGRLARRHQCQVRLTSGERGVVAWVLFPPSLLADQPTGAPAIEAAPVPATAMAPTPETEPEAEADPTPGVVPAAPPVEPVAEPAKPLERRPVTMAEALTLQPSAADVGAPVEPPVQPLAGGGDGSGGAPSPLGPLGKTPSGFTRRVSKSRRIGPQPGPSGTVATPPPTTMPRRSAEDVGSRLSAFQSAVEQGRAESESSADDDAADAEPLEGDQT